MHGFPKYLKEHGYYVTNNSKTDYNILNAKHFVSETWDESSENAGWWNRKPGQPFFAVFNFNDSHQSRTMTAPYAEYQKNVLDLLGPEERIAAEQINLPPFYHGSPGMRKQFARVYNSISLTDKKIGALLERLERDRLLDSTIIFFFADHGEGIPRGKTNGINLGYRVPLVIWFPTIYRNLSPWGVQTVSSELISFEDLAPTLVSLAGVTPPKHMKGRILLGNQRSPKATTIELSSDRSDNGIDMVRSITDGRFIYSRNYLPFMPELRYVNYMEISEIMQIIRNDLSAGNLNALQKGLFEPRPAEFLFDVSHDPWETNNLSKNLAYQSILASMRNDLDKRVLESRDVMFLPESTMKQLKETPYEFRMDSEQYPLEEIYEAAKLSGFAGNDVALKQVKLLSHAQAVVRYWAIVGLRSQPRKIQQKHLEIVKTAMKDNYAPVKITAAAIVHDCDSSSLGARKMLNEYAQGKNADLALLTLNYLLYSNNRKPFIDTIKALNGSSNTPENVKRACEDWLRHLSL